MADDAAAGTAGASLVCKFVEYVPSEPENFHKTVRRDIREIRRILSELVELRTRKQIGLIRRDPIIAQQFELQFVKAATCSIVYPDGHSFIGRNST